MAGRLVLALALLPARAAAAAAVQGTAEQDVAAAQQAKASADDKAAAALKELTRFGDRWRYANKTRGDAAKDALALRIEDAATRETADQLAAAEKDLEDRRAALKGQAEEAAAPSARMNETQQLEAYRAARSKTHSLAKGAERAAKEVERARKERNHAMRQHFDEMRQAEKARARQLGKTARQAAREVLQAARRVRRAQLAAGVDENQAEGEYESAQDANEDFGEDVREKAEDSIEDFFQGVEGRVEDRMDHLEDEAERKHSVERRSIHAMSHNADLDRNMRDIEHRLRAAETADASASASELAALPQRWGVPAYPLLGLAVFGVSASAVVAFGRHRVQIREAPLLG